MEVTSLEQFLVTAGAVICLLFAYHAYLFGWGKDKFFALLLAGSGLAIWALALDWQHTILSLVFLEVLCLLTYIYTRLIGRGTITGILDSLTNIPEWGPFGGTGYLVMIRDKETGEIQTVRTNADTFQELQLRKKVLIKRIPITVTVWESVLSGNSSFVPWAHKVEIQD